MPTASRFGGKKTTNEGKQWNGKQNAASRPARRGDGDSGFYGKNFSPQLPALQHPGQPVALEIHIQSLSIAGQRIMSTQHVWAHAVKASNGPFFVLPTKWHTLHGLLNHQIHDRGYQGPVGVDDACVRVHT
jgi:hypothetical protein